MTTAGIDREAIARLGRKALPVGAKGWPAEHWGAPVAALAGRGLRVLDGDLPLPVAVLDRDALHHNAAVMAGWAQRRGVRLAPHGKTTMAPQLLALQVEHGAWALTAATPVHAQLYAAFGVRRILYANEIAEPSFVRWIAGCQRRDPGFELLCLVDSPAGVALLESALAAAGARPLDVLLEVGSASGRTGARTVAEADAVADAVAGSPHLRLRGIEAFEGLALSLSADAALPAVDALLDRVAEVFARLQRRAAEPLLVSVGGSAYFDRVVERLDPLAGPGRLILRSGGYLVHDGGAYQRLSALDGRRAGDAEGRLRGALEIWSVVLSRPEPGLLLTSMGKRDVGADVDLPAPRRLARDGRPVEAPPGAAVLALSDQHAHVRVPEDADVRVGDLLGCAISHPCTTMDKWRILPVVDRDLTVIDTVTTFF